MPWKIPDVDSPEARSQKSVDDWTASDWKEMCEILLDNTHDDLLDDLEDSVADQSNRLQALGNASSREIRAAVQRGLDRALKPVRVPQTRADKAAGIWRDSQGRGLRIPTKAVAQKKSQS